MDHQNPSQLKNPPQVPLSQNISGTAPHIASPLFSPISEVITILIVLPLLSSVCSGSLLPPNVFLFYYIIQFTLLTL